MIKLMSIFAVNPNDGFPTGNYILAIIVIIVLLVVAYKLMHIGGKRIGESFTELANQKWKTCSECMSRMDIRASKCRYCGSDLDDN